MKLSFHALSTIAAVLFFALALAWLFATGLVLSDWGVKLTPEAALVGRRSAALYAAFGVMFVAARDAPSSPSRNALIKGVVVGCLLLATLGIYELLAGHVTSHILVAVGAELSLGLAFLIAGRKKHS